MKIVKNGWLKIVISQFLIYRDPWLRKKYRPIGFIKYNIDAKLVFKNGVGEKFIATQFIRN
jgi:hypothetical protein